MTDHRKLAELLGFDPDNHHNAAVCPYCTDGGNFVLVPREWRNAVLEEAAAVIDACNKEGPYQAIGGARRIRELKTSDLRCTCGIDERDPACERCNALFGRST